MRVPILCYHRVEVPPAGRADDANFTTPALFTAHLEALARRGYAGVRVDDVVRWQQGHGTLPPRPIAITFDDGYESVATEALPRLARLGWPATLFVVTNEIGGTNAWDPGAPPARLLDATALRDVAAAGHELGAHTATHRRIRGLDVHAADDELRTSRAALAGLLGQPPASFAFPYGSHDAAALDRVRAAGFAAACTLKRWTNGVRTNPLRLGRIGAGGALPPWRLLAKLATAALTPARA